jgi:hypothetical protein
MVRSWAQTFAKRWCEVDLARLGREDFGLYLPTSEADFHWLCMATAAWGGCTEFVTTSPLDQSSIVTLSPVWSSTRPIDYLKGIDLCRALGLRWIYLLGIYTYAPCISVFVSETESIAAEVIELTKDIPDCDVISLEMAINREQQNWEKNFRQIEMGLPLSQKAQAAREELRGAYDSLKKRFEL